MSEEELQRKMEFIVEQQAQFAVDIQKLQESQVAEAALRQSQFGKLTEAVTALVGMVSKLSLAQEKQADAFAELTLEVKQLAVRQSQTDERLNIFINVVERYISREQNGNQPPVA